MLNKHNILLNYFRTKIKQKSWNLEILDKTVYSHVHNILNYHSLNYTTF